MSKHTLIQAHDLTDANSKHTNTQMCIYSLSVIYEHKVFWIGSVLLPVLMPPPLCESLSHQEDTESSIIQSNHSNEYSLNLIFTHLSIYTSLIYR